MNFQGTVIKGNGEAGVQYHLPTANIFVEALGEGVFFGRTNYQHEWFPSLICIRNSGKNKILETHLFGFEGDLYHQHIEVQVDGKIRNLTPFISHDDMRKQIVIDIAVAKQRLGIA